jgi:Flp pilus assembly protein TadD
LKQAWSALDAGRNSDALRLFGKVLSLSPSTSEAQFGKAEALRFAGRKDEAVAAYQRYLELDPSGKDANIAKNALKQLE